MLLVEIAKCEVMIRHGGHVCIVTVVMEVGIVGYGERGGAAMRETIYLSLVLYGMRMRDVDEAGRELTPGVCCVYVWLENDDLVK